MQERRYAIGNNGVLVKATSSLAEGWEKCRDLNHLMSVIDHTLRDDVKPGLKWIGSKMPAEWVKKVLGTVHEYPRTETGYVLYYKFSTKEWYVECPPQSGYAASVRFKGEKAPEGFAEIGTIHTHPEMNAFWSGTDSADQHQNAGGLHIVLGLRNGLVNQHLCTLFTKSGAYDISLWDVFEEVDLTQVYPCVPEWKEVLDKPQKQERFEFAYSQPHTWPAPASAASTLAPRNITVPSGWKRIEADDSDFSFDTEGEENMVFGDVAVYIEHEISEHMIRWSEEGADSLIMDAVADTLDSVFTVVPVIHMYDKKTLDDRADQVNEIVNDYLEAVEIMCDAKEAAQRRKDLVAVMSGKEV